MEVNSLKVGVMQPYFWPYLGYFQLMCAVDRFVVYDNMQFTKRGWINRNRIALNGDDVYITLPIEKASDFLNVNQRELIPKFKESADKMLRTLAGAYSRAAYYRDGLDIAISCLSHPNRNLFDFVLNSINVVAQALNINTPVTVSSSLDVDHSLQGQDRVLAICKHLGASNYINPPGGRSLYSQFAFRTQGVNLEFLEPKIEPYSQRGCADFIPNLSVMDVIMSTGLVATAKQLASYRVE